MQSSILLRHRSVQSKEVQGREEFVRYVDLKKRVGASAAKTIRDSKRKLQQAVIPGQTPFVMKHPDVDSEEGVLQHLKFGIGFSLKSNALLQITLPLTIFQLPVSQISRISRFTEQ